jgi:hypothetical protein
MGKFANSLLGVYRTLVRWGPWLFVLSAWLTVVVTTYLNID